MRNTQSSHFTRLPAFVAIAIIALFSPPAVAQSTGAGSLTDRIGRLVTTNNDLAKATIGVHVRDVATGRVLYDHRGADPLIPASNLKLFTTGAATLVLGPNAVFTTDFSLSGDTLVITGSGDPGFADPKLLRDSSPPLTVEDLLEKIADHVDEHREQIDDIVIDDRIFDRVATHDTWPDDQLNRWYCAEVSGLNFHTNCLTLFFDAGATGSSAQIQPSPAIRPGADWYELSNRTKSIAKGRNTVWIARPTPSNEFTAYGDVLSGPGVSVDVAVHDPGVFFGSVLAEHLVGRGVMNGHKMSSKIRLAEAGDTFDDATTIAQVRTGMADILTRANSDSQNLYTEALIKRMGHEVTGTPGSWTNGSAVVRMIIAERLGADHASAFSIVDGSGMSRENTVAPGTVTAWLTHLASIDQVGPMFTASLPEVGEGTLRNRFGGVKLDNTVRAKSGTIAGVRCLSGYVIDDEIEGRAIAFSVLVNDLTDGRGIRAAKKLHEQVVDAIDDWLSATATPAYGG